MSVNVKTNNGLTIIAGNSSCNVKFLTTTLTAGSTSVSFTDSSFANDVVVDIYTVPTLHHNSATVNGTTVTIEFDAQQSDVSVMIRIEEVL